jgi:hypothetical protein
MNDDMMQNAILAQLRFGIDDIAAQMELIEQMARETAAKSQEAFKNVNLLGGDETARQMTAQQTRINQILLQEEVKKAAIVAEGEAKISAIRAQEALTREQIAQKEAQTELAIIQKQMAEEKILYMQAREEVFAQRGTMGDLLQRRTSWLISGGFVMGGAAALGGTAAVFKDVERDMTTIARISEDAAFNFQYMRDELQQLGVQYGMTWENVSDIAIRWSQAGYNMADTIRLTETALLALNTAELDAEYATQGLIAIMSQWQLTAEDLLPVIDKINKTACAA